jgi:hypothetical protein
MLPPVVEQEQDKHPKREGGDDTHRVHVRWANADARNECEKPDGPLTKAGAEPWLFHATMLADSA